LASWHPILSAHETQPGVWDLIGPMSVPYATVTLVRRGEELGYRATYLPASGSGSELVGYYRTLLHASKRAHLAWVASCGPQRGPNGK
jgi:hypothetical protein